MIHFLKYNVNMRQFFFSSSYLIFCALASCGKLNADDVRQKSYNVRNVQIPHFCGKRVELENNHKEINLSSRLLALGSDIEDIKELLKFNTKLNFTLINTLDKELIMSNLISLEENKKNLEANIQKHKKYISDIKNIIQNIPKFSFFAPKSWIPFVIFQYFPGKKAKTKELINRTLGELKEIKTKIEEYNSNSSRFFNKIEPTLKDIKKSKERKHNLLNAFLTKKTSIKKSSKKKDIEKKREKEVIILFLKETVNSFPQKFKEKARERICWKRIEGNLNIFLDDSYTSLDALNFLHLLSPCFFNESGNIDMDGFFTYDVLVNNGKKIKEIPCRKKDETYLVQMNVICSILKQVIKSSNPILFRESIKLATKENITDLVSEIIFYFCSISSEKGVLKYCSSTPKKEKTIVMLLLRNLEKLIPYINSGLCHILQAEICKRGSLKKAQLYDTFQNLSNTYEAAHKVVCPFEVVCPVKKKRCIVILPEHDKNHFESQWNENSVPYKQLQAAGYDVKIIPSFSKKYLKSLAEDYSKENATQVNNEYKADILVLAGHGKFSDNKNNAGYNLSISLSIKNTSDRTLNFSKEEDQQFFVSLVKRLLKPGGEIILESCSIGRGAGILQSMMNRHFQDGYKLHASLYSTCGTLLFSRALLNGKVYVIRKFAPYLSKIIKNKNNPGAYRMLKYEANKDIFRY